jgi:DNA-directed RNA polymerase subunit RPC12/RpoP
LDGRAVSVEGRLRRLEERSHGGRCPECGLPHGHGYMVMIDEERPEESFQGDPNERCARCSRSLYTVLRVVYDSPEVEEGGGA